jgi:SEC-C motif-containing protein
VDKTLTTRPCPCGSASYDGCCGRLHRGEQQAASPEELMRSRYSAYVVGDTGYVWRTWHPRTRPESVEPDPTTTWTGLEILAADEDSVEFRAHHDRSVLHERSRFEKRAGRWFYVDGTVLGG